MHIRPLDGFSGYAATGAGTGVLRQGTTAQDGIKYLRLNDGRLLAYNEYGNSQGFPLFYFHNHASSRLEGGFFDQAAARNQFRIISVDRPGMGFSDFKPSLNQSEFARDLIELADCLRIERFGLLAWAGGGPFAFAVSYLYPQRVEFLLSLACVPAQFAHSAGTWRALYANWIKSASLSMMRLFIRVRHQLSGKEPMQYIQRLRESLCYSDRKILNDPRILKALSDDAREALRQGYKGIAHDSSLCFRNWAFELEDIKVPVHLWQGTADTLVPCRHSEYLAARLSNATFHRVPHRGHFFFLQCMDEIFAAARAKTLPDPQLQPAKNTEVPLSWSRHKSTRPTSRRSVG